MPVGFKPAPKTSPKQSAATKRLRDAHRRRMLDQLPKRPGNRDYSRQGRGPISNFYHRLPPFHIYWVELMQRDETVQLGLSTIKAPVEAMTPIGRDGDVKHDSPKIRVTCDEEPCRQFLAKQLKQFWKTGLHHALSIVEYGYSPAEVVNKENRKTGQLEFAELYPLDPYTTRPLTLEGVYSGVQVGGNDYYRGGSKHRLFGAKSFWAVNEPDRHRFFGRSRLFGAFRAWLEKTDDGGGLDTSNLWHYKCAYTGHVVRFPANGSQTFTNEDGEAVTLTNQEYAQDVAEALKTGSAISLPNEYDEFGNPLWSIEPPTVNGSGKDQLDHLDNLDRRIYRGMKIPPEVLEAADTGGYAGRRVPAQAFYASCERILNQIFAAFSPVLNELCFVNFGYVPDYEIDSDPIAPQAAAGGQQPQGQDGGLGALLGGGSGVGPDKPQASGIGKGERFSQDVGEQAALIDADRLVEMGLTAYASRVAELSQRLRQALAATTQDHIAGVPASDAERTAMLSGRVAIAQRIIEAFEPELADAISDHMIAAWILGAEGVADQLPLDFEIVEESETGDAGYFTEPLGDASLPPNAPIFPAAAPEDSPVRLVKIENAVRNLQTRGIVPRGEFERLTREAKDHAFTVAGDHSAEVLGKVRDALVKVTQEGASLDEFESLIDASVGEALPNNLREVVFRNNVQTAYRVGQNQILDDPLIRDEFPYVEDMSVRDARRSSACDWFATAGIDGTAVYRRDDPIYQRFPPPRHHNCRTGQRPLTVEDAASMGIREAQEWLRTGEEPASPYRMPYPPAEVLKAMFPAGNRDAAIA